jgi:hypothetical protein
MQTDFASEFGSGGEGGGSCLEENLSEFFLATPGRFLFSVAIVVALTTCPCLLLSLWLDGEESLAEEDGFIDCLEDGCSSLFGNDELSSDK